MMKQVQKGFTLIELMIVIAIIGILAAIAVPQYSTYTKRAKFSEVKMAVAPVKSAIEACYARNGGNATCNASAGSPTISSQVTTAVLDSAAMGDKVASVAMTPGAVPLITATASAGELAGNTFVITGTVTGTPGTDAWITGWAESGTGCDAGWC